MRGVMKQHPYLTLSYAKKFYNSSIVINSFNKWFSGRWHTRIAPDLPGINSSEQYLCTILQIQPHHHVLDFGSGVGVTTCDVACMTGCRVRGLNISEKQVDISKQYARQIHFESYVAFDLYEGYEFPYLAHTFDRVLFFESPCHVPHKELLFKEIYRVLKPGGVCGGQDWMITEKEIRQDEYEKYISPIELACAVSLRSMDDYRDLFKKAGFSMIRTINGRHLYSGISNSFTKPSEMPIVVDKNEDLDMRLHKGNIALGNAFHKGLFTVGFIFGYKEW